MLALYLHLVGAVCRDVERTVEGKLLKVSILLHCVQRFKSVSHCLVVCQSQGDVLCRYELSQSCVCLPRL